MGISLKFADNVFQISGIKYIKKDKTFRCSYENTVDNIIEYIDIPYVLEENQEFPVKHTDFTLYLFHKDNFVTNDIFQIKYSQLRLGWFFPLEALLTDEHDLAQNEHFWPYSLNAYKKLLLTANEIPFKTISYDENFGIDKVFGSNTFIFIVYNKYLKEYKKITKRSFLIEDYLPYLYSLGFTLLTNDNFLQLIKIKDTTPYTPSTEKVIKLKSISPELFETTSYINALIQGLLKLEDHCLVRFHLLYQIIELLITKIFEKEFKELMPTFLSAVDFYDAKESLNKLSNEKDRINKLFNNYCSATDITNDLCDSCNGLLQLSYPGKVLGNCSHALYKVRSHLFHNLRQLPPEYSVKLNVVNTHLEKMVLHLLISYKNPD